MLFRLKSPRLELFWPVARTIARDERGIAPTLNWTAQSQDFSDSLRKTDLRCPAILYQDQEIAADCALQEFRVAMSMSNGRKVRMRSPLIRRFSLTSLS